ncbi:plastocyanin/azurin family copper-binding protein [Haladaptatus pallidirubidus]|uniref:Blue (type 1) copper domain-containing protein n=1 Tax=Haladaptatus pallidirubidus TaxID=1008152 RepID=A0AAV3UJJ7_9EURY|nr:plastocyanin/azurin family copper-binding protein [Haladaptatus pallidirubidus]
MNDQPRTSRRTALKVTGSALAATALAGCTSSLPGNEDSNQESDSKNKSKSESDSSQKGKEIRLGAKQSGWEGRAPKSIKGKKNPALTLQPGQKYTITWENLDGKEHELYIVNGNDKPVVKSEDAEEKGKTVSTTFTASKKLAQYYCEYHPQSMRGDVNLQQKQ